MLKRLTAIMASLAVAILGLAPAASAVPLHEVPATAVHHWSEADPEVVAEHGAAAVQAWIDAYWRQVWIDTTNWNRWMEAAARAEAEAAYPSGQCGGDLPPCWVMVRESKGNIRIWNGGCYAPYGWAGGPPCPRGRSTASGKWQFVRGTWAGHGGYLNAADAPERVQDDKAREVWAGGRGCSHWSAC